MKTNSCIEREKIVVDYMAQLWIAFHSYNNINVEYSCKHLGRMVRTRGEKEAQSSSYIRKIQQIMANTEKSRSKN